MPYLFFDTETTGLPLWKKPSNDPKQPHIIQLAAILQDESGKTLDSMNMLIKPDGWTIPAKITELTGISQDMAEKYGIPLAAALHDFLCMAEGADLVAHNAQFDIRMLRMEFLRKAITGGEGYAAAIKDKSVKVHCTADMATPIVNLPPTPKMVAAGFTKPKRCKLAEAVKFFFGEDLEGAHNALVDVEACARIFWHMRSLEGVV